MARTTEADRADKTGHSSMVEEGSFRSTKPMAVSNFHTSYSTPAVTFKAAEMGMYFLFRSGKTSVVVPATVDQV
jgi:hypothetical protein